MGKVLLQLSGFASCQRRHVLRYLLHCGLFQVGCDDQILGVLTATREKCVKPDVWHVRIGKRCTELICYDFEP